MQRSSKKIFLQTILGSLSGLLLIWLLFRGTEWAAIFDALGKAHLSWIALSLILLFGSHFLRIQRWVQIIHASHQIRHRPIFSAAQLGFLANVTLPMRLGEGIRALLLSRLAKIRFSTSMGLVVLDRAADAFALLVVALISLIGFPLNRDAVLPAGTFGNTQPYTLPAAILKSLTISVLLILTALLILLILLYFQQRLILRLIDRPMSLLPRKIATGLRSVLEGFSAGMGLFRSGPQMLRALSLSLLAWGCTVLALAAIMKSFSVEFPWVVPFAMQAMIALFASAPIAPGLIGQFHLAVIACLLIAVPGVTLSETRAVALAAHFFCLLPVILLGLWALLLERAALLGLPLRPTLDPDR